MRQCLRSGELTPLPEALQWAGVSHRVPAAGRSAWLALERSREEEKQKTLRLRTRQQPRGGASHEPIRSNEWWSLLDSKSERQVRLRRGQTRRMRTALVERHRERKAAAANRGEKTLLPLLRARQALPEAVVRSALLQGRALATTASVPLMVLVQKAQNEEWASRPAVLAALLEPALQSA